MLHLVVISLVCSNLGHFTSLCLHNHDLLKVTKANQWEKVMAPHSSTVARRIPWMEKPGRLQSMGLHRVGHD